MLKIVACVDIDVNRARSLSESFNIPHYGTNYSKFILKAKPSFIIIATPDETHFSILENILEMDFIPKLIICEKPICFVWDEYQKLVNHIKNKNIDVIVNHSRRFDNRFQKLKKEIRKNTFGHLVRGDFNTYGNWKKNGIHLIDSLVYLLSHKIENLPLKINTKKVNLKNGKWTDISIEFGNEFIINLNEHIEDYYQLFEMDFKFTKGRILFQDFENRLFVEKKQINFLNENILNPAILNSEEKQKSNMQSMIELVEAYFVNKKSLNEFSLKNMSATMKIYLKLLTYYEN